MNISVVIPAFNSEAWIGGAIDSVLRQRTPAHEIIVIDDGSQDRTAEVAASYARTRVLRQENKGLSAARNAGAASATGEALMFLDSDDVLLPDALEVLTRHAQAAETWGAIIPNFIDFDDPTLVAWPSRSADRVLSRESVAGLIRKNGLSPNALVRKHVWARNAFDENLRACEDLDFWLRLLFDGNSIVVVSRPSVAKRIDREGALSSKRTLMRQHRRAVFEKVWERSDLTAAERRTTLIQIIRASFGEAASRLRDGMPGGEAVRGLRGSSCVPTHTVARALSTPGLLRAVSGLDRIIGGSKT